VAESHTMSAASICRVCKERNKAEKDAIDGRYAAMSWVKHLGSHVSRWGARAGERTEVTSPGTPGVGVLGGQGLALEKTFARSCGWRSLGQTRNWQSEPA